MAANSAFGANGQPGYGANGFDTPYGAGAGYDPAQTFGGGESPSIAMVLPPPLHSGIPGRDDDEDRWKKGTKGAGPGGKKGKGPWKDVPASQNTRRPLCTFFAQGRCRFGEECTFSHDASKLGKGS